MKYLFTAAIVTAALIACNSNDDKTTETKEAPHDAHAATTTPVEMPAMPEIPANAKVFFVNLKDGQTVTSPLKIEMGVENLKVDTANGILKSASGHHHLLVDVDSIATEKVVPPTDSLHHYHFGKAQTSAEIKLTPGKHTLVLQFADAMHRSYGSKLTSRITVDVKQ
jgi:hypothetical protein